MQNF